MVQPMQEPTAPFATKKPRVGRRAFLATAATVAVCGAGAIAAPQVIPAVEAKMRDIGQTAILNEIGSLEGVSLDAAIRAAEITSVAVKILVLPLARFVSAVGAGGLGLLLGALDIARGATSLLRLDTSVLDAFRAVVVSWQSGVSSLPITLDAYATADIEGAEKYLRALKQLAEHPHVA